MHYPGTRITGSSMPQRLELLPGEVRVGRHRHLLIPGTTRLRCKPWIKIDTPSSRARKRDLKKAVCFECRKRLQAAELQLKSSIGATEKS